MADAVQGKPWNERLLEPFPANEIAAKPRVWCGDCRRAESRVCARHELIRCEGCKQRITSGHLHLDYVGHADVTRRLLEVDPEWDWYPAYSNPDKDVLLAAIATGDVNIVDAVIRNAPPLIDGQGGMWMYLEIHADDGTIVKRLGYGDAEGKTGPDAMKERIGDGIRNCAMRQGVALDQWSRADRQEGIEKQGDPLPGPAAAKQPAAKTARRARGAAAEDKPDGKDAVQDARPVHPTAQFLADEAWKLGTDTEAGPAGLLAKLKADVHDGAHEENLLRLLVAPPWDPAAARVNLLSVITRAKQQITARISKDQPAGEQP